MSPTPNAEKKYLTTRQLQERWGGCSHMLIERKVKNDPNFPKPLRISRHKLWDADEIAAYERAAAAAKQSAR